MVVIGGGAVLPLNVEEDIPSERPDSFLNPTGADARIPAPSGLGKWAEVGLFLFFVGTRALHPTIIHRSKSANPETGEEGFAYSTISVIVVDLIFQLVALQLVALYDGGYAQWRSIWKHKRALQVFGGIGFVLAFGDYLEMASMGKMSGAAYQILLQSKFVCTAIMMMYIKGAAQTRLQWVLLVSLMLTMSLYMALKDGSAGGEVPVLGMLMAFAKVLISCFAGVLLDKHMKELKEIPTHVQIVQITLPQLLSTLMLSFTEPATWDNGFFDGWNLITVGVSMSFVVKALGSLYLLKSLDSLLKNIGEAVAVLVIYALEVGPSVFCMAEGAAFDGNFPPACEVNVPRFLAVSTVFMIVMSYLETKAITEKVAKYDAQTAKRVRMDAQTALCRI